MFRHTQLMTILCLFGSIIKPSSNETTASMSPLSSNANSPISPTTKRYFHNPYTGQKQQFSAPQSPSSSGMGQSFNNAHSDNVVADNAQTIIPELSPEDCIKRIQRERNHLMVLSALHLVPKHRLNEPTGSGQTIAHNLLRLPRDSDQELILEARQLGVDFTLPTLDNDNNSGATPAHYLVSIFTRGHNLENHTLNRLYNLWQIDKGLHFNKVSTSSNAKPRTVWDLLEKHECLQKFIARLPNQDSVPAHYKIDSNTIAHQVLQLPLRIEQGTPPPPYFLHANSPLANAIFPQHFEKQSSFDI